MTSLREACSRYENLSHIGFPSKAIIPQASDIPGQTPFISGIKRNIPDRFPQGGDNSSNVKSVGDGQASTLRQVHTILIKVYLALRTNVDELPTVFAFPFLKRAT